VGLASVIFPAQAASGVLCRTWPLNAAHATVQNAGAHQGRSRSLTARLTLGADKSAIYDSYPPARLA
jgi:hypothetical protein